MKTSTVPNVKKSVTSHTETGIPEGSLNPAGLTSLAPRVYLLVESLEYNGNIGRGLRNWGMDVTIHFRPEDIIKSCDRNRPGCVVVLLEESSVRTPKGVLTTLKSGISGQCLSLPIIVYMNRPNIQEALSFLRFGADDIIGSSVLSGNWEEVIRLWVGKSNKNLQKLNETFCARERFKQLSDNVKETAQMIYLGCSNNEIAAATGKKLRTVELRRAQLMQAMKANNFAELIRSLSLTLEVS